MVFYQLLNGINLSRKYICCKNFRPKWEFHKISNLLLRLPAVDVASLRLEHPEACFFAKSEQGPMIGEKWRFLLKTKLKCSKTLS
jgi:hypothetical protein